MKVCAKYSNFYCISVEENDHQISTLTFAHTYIRSDAHFGRKDCRRVLEISRLQDLQWIIYHDDK